MQITPRGWQEEALTKFEHSRNLAFLIEATPGAGKTIFSAQCAKILLDRKLIDFVVIVAPTTALKGDAVAGFLGDWNKLGIQLTTSLKPAGGRPTEFDGGVCTYQQLPHLMSTLEIWARNSCRIMFVFDEIHHASEDNTWGATVESCGRIATKMLSMTGTPFRGDGRRISFVTYDANAIAVADHRYTYREAVRDRVCRAVVFMTDDGLAQYELNETDEEIRISEATVKDDAAAIASRVIFNRDSPWLRRVIEKAEVKLEEYRAIDINAACLLICRPGTDPNDDRHLHMVAKLVKEITGETPEVITHEDQDANSKIERFRSGSQKWICSVRKISEGVDIKRLRVQVMANRPSTELLFRQLVGRVVRVDDPDPRRSQDATVFMAKFPQLTEWAERISGEAQAGLQEIEKRGPNDPTTEPGPGRNFIPGTSTHEDGGAISDFGELFEADEIDIAERLKRDDAQLADVPLTKIAHLIRKLDGPLPEKVIRDEPLAIQKKRVRDQMVNVAKRVAYKLNSESPDFKAPWIPVFRQTGAKNLDDLMDNKNLDVMRQALSILEKQLSLNGEANVA